MGIEDNCHCNTKFNMNIRTMAEWAAEGKSPEILFWVGCAGSFDDRYKKVTLAVCRILDKVGMTYGVLGSEESCSGDPARRAGNEFLFQMQALMNIQTMQAYEVKKVVTACPHCFNTLKNEYPALGGDFEVVHHSELLQQLINAGKIKATALLKLTPKKFVRRPTLYDHS